MGKRVFLPLPTRPQLMAVYPALLIQTRLHYVRREKFKFIYSSSSLSKRSSLWLTLNSQGSPTKESACSSSGLYFFISFLSYHYLSYQYQSYQYHIKSKADASIGMRPPERQSFHKCRCNENLQKRAALVWEKDSIH